MSEHDEQRALAVSIGRRLRWAREGHGLSRPELALQLGITANMIRHIETGVRVPSVFLATTLCNVLGISPQYLLWGVLQECERSLTAKLSRAHPELRLPGEEVKHSEMPAPGKRGGFRSNVTLEPA